MRRLAIAAAVLALAGCGDDNEKEASAPEPTATATAEATPPPANLKNTKVKPVIAKPEGQPPAELDITDIVRGRGKPARPGDLLTVDYVGATFSTGTEFDASWDRGEPFQFPLGQQQVIPGWDQGLAGMRKGGRRQLVIPSDLAYGPQGSPPTIGPNEPLVFIVDLRKID